MKTITIKILTVPAFFLLCLAYAGSPVYAQQNINESPIRELPKADQCSLVVLHIRELAFSLKQVNKEISRLEQPVRSASTSDEVYAQQMDEYEQKLKLLQEQETSLRKQMDLKEQQLANCLHRDSPPEKK